MSFPTLTRHTIRTCSNLDTATTMEAQLSVTSAQDRSRNSTPTNRSTTGHLHRSFHYSRCQYVRKLVQKTSYVELPPQPTDENVSRCSSVIVKKRSVLLHPVAEITGPLRRVLEQTARQSGREYAAEKKLTALNAYKKLVSTWSRDDRSAIRTILNTSDGVVQVIALADARLDREILIVWELVGHDASVRIVAAVRLGTRQHTIREKMDAYT
jgi:hypothetical protein